MPQITLSEIDTPHWLPLKVWPCMSFEELAANTGYGCEVHNAEEQQS
jgi:hypothetical protein